MTAKKGIFTKTGMLVAGAMLALLTFGPYASANPVRIHFSGAMGSGYADLTLGGTDPADVVDPAHPPVTITSATGMFNGATITGLQPLNYATPPAGETMIPHSYSLFPIPKDKGGGEHEGVSYDNLFYPENSPLICYIEGKGFVYPFSGGFLDLMGVMFVLDNGNFVDLWSYGNTDPGFFGPTWPGGLVYGIKVIQPTTDGYVVLAGPPFAKAYVPEPGFLWLLGAGLVGLFAWRLSVERKKVRVTR